MRLLILLCVLVTCTGMQIAAPGTRSVSKITMAAKAHAVAVAEADSNIITKKEKTKELVRKDGFWTYCNQRACINRQRNEMFQKTLTQFSVCTEVSR